jgi:hypothetical protein
MSNRYCCLCKNQVLKEQSIDVIALGVKCTDNSGNYVLIGDFLDKEQIVHSQCLDKCFPSLRETLLKNITPIAKELYNFLKELGEKPSIKEIEEFTEKSNQTDLNGLITLWFTKRKVFGQKS